MPRFAFSSQDLPPHLDDRQRSHMWADFISQSGGSMHVDVPCEGRFHAKVKAALFGEASITRCDTSSLRLERKTQHVARDGNDGVFLLCSLSQHPIDGHFLGREFSLKSGAAALIANGHPNMTQSFEGGGKVLAISLPYAALAQRGLRTPEDVAGREIAARKPSLRMARHYARMLMADPATGMPDIAPMAMGHLADLVVAALGAGERPGAPEAEGLRAARRQAIREAIQQRFRDPKLDCAGIAAEVGVSTRYVQRLLEDVETTFTSVLRETRLVSAHRELRDPAATHRTIHDIAYANGFADLTTFNRGFRNRFGKTPGEARQRG